MATQTYEVNNDAGADMDYAEHEKTYTMFLSLAKWGVISVCALLVAMAVGLMMGGGFIGGLLTFIVLMIAAKIIA